MSRTKAWLVSSTLLLAACGSSGSGGASGGAAGATSGGSGGSGGTTMGGSGGMAGSSTGGTSVGGAAGSGGGTTNPIVEMETSMGKMVFELDAVNMPATTANFLSYVDAGFYSGTIFHRVIPDFVIQGGGFSSGLVKKQTNAPIALETSPSVLHDYGAISMARTNDPNSATSQFFVVNAKAGSHSLDGDYAAFGHMIEGDAVLDAISAVQTQTQGAYQDVPVTEVVVTAMTHK